MSIRAQRRDERGQALSGFVAVVLVALFLTAGLVIDGGSQAAAARRAQGAAAEAARAAVDEGAVARVAGDPMSPSSVRASAESVLHDRGVQGSVTVDGTVVHVATSQTVPTHFLGLIGIGTLTAHGEASADLRES